MKFYYVSFLIVGCVGQNYIGSNVATSKVNDVRYGDGVKYDYSNYFGSGINSNIGDYVEKNNAGGLKNENMFTPNYGAKFDFKYDQGNPDINATLVRPCEVFDMFCIRRFFASHARCKITDGPIPDPVYRAQLTVNHPSINASATQNGIEYRGINTGKIEQFYYNKDTDNLVIEIGFDFIAFFSNNTYVKYYQRGREPVVTNDFGGIRYEQLTVTAVIPKVNDLRLEDAEMYTYAFFPEYTFTIGPGIAASADPGVQLMLADYAADLRTNQQEAQLTEGPFYATTYIQKNICDFGLKVL